MKAFITSTCLSFMLLLAMTSCTNASLEESMIPVEKDSFQSLLIERGTTPITAEQAVNVAKLFEMRNKPSTKTSSSKEVAGVQTINDNDGQPVMYVVSYQKNQGFTIVSASRKYKPILAEEDTNSFYERRHESGLEIWIQEQTALITFAESLPETDESIKRYVDEWKDYEQIPVSDLSTKSDDLLTLRANSIAAWEAQGYTCFDLCDCPNSLPQSVYEDWLDLAEQMANPDYNYYTNSIILYLREDTLLQYGPYLTTTWGQDDPYNANLDLINNQLPRAGCSVVAMGQIMKYYEWPTCYDWSAMNNSYHPDSTAAEVAELFDDLGHDANTSYGILKSTTLINNMVSAITSSQKCYHYNATRVTHNFYTAKSELYNERPVFMQGAESSSSGSNAHAWVCDGYKTYSTHRNYILMILSPDEPLAYVSAGVPYNSYENTDYMHMNWGEDGKANGWFYEDNVHFSGMEYGVWIEFNFPSQREDIIGITPNTSY